MICSKHELRNQAVRREECDRGRDHQQRRSLQLVSLAYFSFASQLLTSTCKANMFASTSTAASASVQCACRCQCRGAVSFKAVHRSASTYTHPVRPVRGWKLPDFAQAKRSVDLPAPKVQLFENKVSAVLLSCTDARKLNLHLNTGRSRYLTIRTSRCTLLLLDPRLSSIKTPQITLYGPFLLRKALVLVQIPC